MIHPIEIANWTAGGNDIPAGHYVIEGPADNELLKAADDVTVGVRPTA